MLLCVLIFWNPVFQYGAKQGLKCCNSLMHLTLTTVGFLCYFMNAKGDSIRLLPDSLFKPLIKSLIQYPTLEILHRNWSGVLSPIQILWRISRVGYWIRDLIRDLKWKPGTDLITIWETTVLCMSRFLREDVHLVITFEDKMSRPLAADGGQPILRNLSSLGSIWNILCLLRECFSP